MNIYIPILLLPLLLLAQKNIVCENGSCSADGTLNVSEYQDLILKTQFTLTDPDDDINLFTNSNESPRDVLLNLSSTTPVNMSVNMSSSKVANNSGEAILIADAIGDLNIALNGRNGEDANIASRECATRILNDELGGAVKSQFLLRRIQDNTLPSDKCVTQDLNDISNNQFTCPTDFTESDGTLTSSRWEKRRWCKGQAERKMCVEKKMRVSCIWLGESWTAECGTAAQRPADIPGLPNWQYDPNKCTLGETSGWFIDMGDRIVSEEYIINARFSGLSDSRICDQVSGRMDVLKAHYPTFHTNQTADATYNNIENEYYYDVDNRVAVNKRYQRWYGRTGDGVNAAYDIYEDSNFKLIELEAYRAFISGYSKFTYHYYPRYTYKPDQPNNSPYHDRGRNFVRVGAWAPGTSGYLARTTYTGHGEHYELGDRGSIWCGKSSNYINCNIWRIKCFSTCSFTPCFPSPRYYSNQCSGETNPWENLGNFNTEASYVYWETKSLYLAPNGKIIRQYHHRGIGSF